MSVRNLQHLFSPRSVALVGASGRAHSVGNTVLRNLLDGYRGTLYPVNPKYDSLDGHRVWHSVDDLPEPPELAVICTPPATVPGIVAQLGARGTRAAVVITAGLSGTRDARGRTLAQATLEAARPSLLRILGPNCVGLLVPSLGLNASFAHVSALPGQIAFVSQSGALVTGVLDWARSRGIGFSRFVSLGDSADVDVGDLLDYLGADAATHAVLLYIEDVRQARKFMSAARAAARSKPVIVLKAGRAKEGARAAASHTGAMAGSDDVIDCAIRRAGMLRVHTTEDLFSAVETLARARPLAGERLAILTNGGGPGVMATDALVAAGGTLATLDTATIATLDTQLPANWSRANPVDIIGDAPEERYCDALQALLRDGGCDAVLFIHAPTAIVPSQRVAQAIAPIAARASRTVLTCWLGGDGVAEARAVCARAGLPVFGTPEEAVAAFMQLVHYRRNQELLMEAPAMATAGAPVRREQARALLRGALAQGRTMLDEPEARMLLEAYGIATVATRSAGTAAEAAACARDMGFPVALKIMSPDVTHKSDVGGVALDLGDEAAVLQAAHAMAARLARLRPGARLAGFTVQAMARRPEAHELIAGLSTDPVFGPVVLFGQGGIAVEVMADRALALPPLNTVLARDLVARTRIARLLAGYRGRAPANMAALYATLARLSQLAIDLPEVMELDINPLLCDSAGTLALDARVKIGVPANPADPLARLAILPYPEQLERELAWEGEPLVLRPIRPEDGPAHAAFFRALTPEDVRLRMFAPVHELRGAQLARFTQIDYDREMAFVATRRPAQPGAADTLGVVRAVSDPDNLRAEFAVTVRSDLKGRGLGRLLMEAIIGYCRARGLAEIVGETLPENTRMIALARSLGFEVGHQPGADTTRLRLVLDSARAGA